MSLHSPVLDSFGAVPKKGRGSIGHLLRLQVTRTPWGPYLGPRPLLFSKPVPNWKPVTMLTRPLKPGEHTAVPSRCVFTQCPQVLPSWA